MGSTPSGKSFDPEEGVGYEIGIKNELFDDRLSSTLAFFHIDKENVLALDPATDSSRAMGKARSRGFDLAGHRTSDRRRAGNWRLRLH